MAKDAGAAAEPAAPVTAAEMHQVGVVAEIVQVNQPNENLIHVLVATHERLRVLKFIAEKPVLIARVEYLLETDMSDNAELKAYSISVVQAAP